MKQIIEGKTYDTETARFIAGNIYPLTCYELYQTEAGEYFEYCETEQRLWGKDSNPKEIKPCSDDYAQGFIEYATENNMVCTYDVWKRKKRVFKEIQDYVTNHLYNPYKETDWDIITVSERDGYLRIYDTSIFVCIGLEKGDDWEGKFDFLKDEGVEVVYLPRTPEISTTQIKKDLKDKAANK